MQAEITKENDKVIKDCTSKFSALRQGARKTLPTVGEEHTKIIAEVNGYAQDSRKFYTDKGNISGAVYTSDDKHW